MMTLREYRIEAGLTLVEMGRLLGRHFSTVHRWETGVVMPRADELARIEALTGDRVRAASFVEVQDRIAREHAL
jgi:transcriptional regulator with XRE-family HTH domain